VQADLLHDISDVGLCERQVLEGSDNALELKGIRNRTGTGGLRQCSRTKGHPQQEAPSHQPTSPIGRLESYTACSLP
jgi:hypothetical protein